MTKHGWPVTFSIGLITYEIPPVSTEEMIAQADRLTRKKTDTKMT
jgi:hypothetical protein